MALRDKLYSGGGTVGQYQSPTIFGQQVVCVAEYWLSQKCKELRKNEASACVQNFIDEYYGSSHPKYEPWCAIFPWFVINECSKLIGCSHKYPGARETYGNALKTKDLAAKSYAYDSTPIAGSVMYRKSNDKTASGHMGIVVYVIPDTGVFYTIEGNINLGDGTEGIGLWEYQSKDIAGYQMGFIHTEKNPCSATKTLAYKGFKCDMPLRPTGSPLVPGGQIVETGSGGQAKKSYLTPPSGGESSGKEETGGQSGGQEQTGGQSTETQPKPSRPCVEIIINIPPEDRLLSWTAVKDLKVAADITGAKFSDKFREEDRNGSAFGYFGASKNPGQYTGFGMFSSVSGIGKNTSKYSDAVPVFILSLAQGKAKYILDNFVGPDFYYIEFEGFYGNGKYENIANKIVGNYPIQTTPNFYFGKIHDWKNKNPNNLKRIDEGLKNVSNGAFNFPQFLDYIFHPDIIYEYPVVIAFSDEKPVNIGRQLLQALSITTAMLGFMKIPGITPDMLKQADSLITTIESGVTVGSLPSLLGGAAEFILPESVKRGAKDWFNHAKSNVEGMLSTIKFQDVANSIGIDVTQIEILSRKYTTYATDAIADVTKFVSGSMSDVNKTMHDLSNMLMINQIKKDLRTNDLQDKIIRSTKITQVPIIQDIFLAGSADTVLPATAGIDAIVKTMITDPDKYFEEFGKKSGSGNGKDLQKALVGAAFGYIPPKKIFNEYVYSSLYQQVMAAGDKYVIPPSIPDDEAYCYKIELDKEFGSRKEIIHCPTGYEWDKSLQKCVSRSTVQVKLTPDEKETEKTVPGAGTTNNQTGFKTGLVPDTGVKTGLIPDTGIKTGLVPDTGVRTGFVPDTGFRLPIEEIVYKTPEKDVQKPVDEGVTKVPVLEPGGEVVYKPFDDEPDFPIIPDVPQPPVVPDKPVTPPVTPLVPYVPPSTPQVPYTPPVKVPETPTYPDVPYKQQYIPIPDCIEVINNKYFYTGVTGTILPAKVQDLGTAQEKWFTEYNGQWRELVNCQIKLPQTQPDTERRYDPECGCELQYPKMVTESKKTIFQYPKCDEHCCEDDYC